MATFTRPTELPEWAVNNVNLPGTGQTNKVAPKLSLRQIGLDKLEVPTAEEWNSWNNNVYQWIGYNDERVNDLRTEVNAINSFDLDFQHVGTVASGRVDMAGFRWQWGNVQLTIPDTLNQTVNMTQALSAAFPTAVLGATVNLSPTQAGDTPAVTVSIEGRNNEVFISAHRNFLPAGVSGGQVITVGYLAWGH